jgi:predicted  nucleic acid-binding Zn-ribbon protein
MDKDLERIIALQKLDSAAQDAQHRLADGPEREKAFTARLAAAGERLAAAKAQLATNQQARREVEKELAVHQGRLSKFREQAMAVKTNVEYHAFQKEIGFAQGEIKSLEDRILEQMLEADDLTAAGKRAEQELAAEQKAVEAERRTIASETGELRATLERIAAERASLVSGIQPQILALFQQVARKRNGIGVAEARAGICTICHVRLRPQVFNTVRRNDAISQCDHCNRILYFVPAPVAEPAPNGATQPAS